MSTTNIVQELLNEANSIAGTPLGFLRLIHLVTEEIEKIDFRNDPGAELHYAALLRLYVFCRRRYHSLKNGSRHACEGESLNQLKNIMLARRKEMQEYAKESLNDEKIKTIKIEVGRSISRNIIHVEAL